MKDEIRTLNCEYINLVFIKKYVKTPLRYDYQHLRNISHVIFCFDFMCNMKWK